MSFSDRDLATDQAPIPPADRVDLPQSYHNWRDYAFSEYPEDAA